MKQCKICGKMFEPKTSTTQMCSEECVAAARKISLAKTQEKLKQKNRERLGTRICVECGKEFAPRSGIVVCCGPICQDERTKKIRRAWQENAWGAEKPEKKKKKKKSESLASFNARAREAGMTYGQYSLYLSMKGGSK